MEDVSPEERDQACLTDDMPKELTETALAIEKLYDGVPQDIEWAFSSGGNLSLLQSRPITNLPVQPIKVVREPTPPAKILYRRQIVENMPDPICNLFEELYLTQGLQSSQGNRDGSHNGAAHGVRVGTAHAEASNIPTVRFKETQIRNDATSDTLNGFPVSSGTVTAAASVILSQTEFDKMSPGTILVAPNTTPTWTQLFSHAVGLVTDMGSILAHGSIVAREYGIPAVLGVGNGTLRIHHGQMLTINGDAGTVVVHEEIMTGAAK